MVNAKRLPKAVPISIRVTNACNAFRTAAWLVGGDYESMSWTVSDSGNPTNTRTINFNYTMPDGRTLLDYPKFLAAIKEFAFFVRSPRFSGINDAEGHCAIVQNLMAIAHGLALEGLSSFEAVSEKFLRVFIQRIHYGGEGLLKASERIETWLQERKDLSESQMRKELPLTKYGNGWRLAGNEFFTMLGLPMGVRTFPRVAFFLNRIRVKANLFGQELELSDAPPVVPRVSVTSITRFLQSLEILFFMRAAIDAIGLPQRPFNFSISRYATKHGTPHKPTPLPPPELALHLMSNAMVWVKNYGPSLLQLVEEAKRLKAKPEEFDGESRTDKEDALLRRYPQEGPAGSPWPLAGWARNRSGVEGLSLHMAVMMLLTACMIVIATFSARRLKELQGLEKGDIRRDPTGAIWLRSFIEKTIQGKEWIPTAEVVELAFSILTKLSAEARAASGEAFITKWSSPFMNDNYSSILIWQPNHLNAFAAHVNVPLFSGANGELTAWKWNSHQFRRFFAVLYFYRYRGASIDILAYFLRHLDLEMTKKYLKLSRDQLRAFREVENQYHETLASNIIAGKGDKVGAGRELKRRLINRFSKGVRASSPTYEEQQDFLTRQMKARRWVIRTRPWGDCTCPATEQGAEAAMCRQVDVPSLEPGLGPDLANSAPCICAGCPHVMDNGHLEEQLSMEKLGYSDLACHARRQLS